MLEISFYIHYICKDLSSADERSLSYEYFCFKNKQKRVRQEAETDSSLLSVVTQIQTMMDGQKFLAVRNALRLQRDSEEQRVQQLHAQNPQIPKKKIRKPKYFFAYNDIEMNNMRSLTDNLGISSLYKKYGELSDQVHGGKAIENYAQKALCV